ncbi:MAG: AAA family ATPase [Micromonosporaceae bacterium]|nr:AAA family ATPase [Micromonosporaceae bacterium]
MPYAFQILGPVGLARAGEPVRPGPPKRQAMLAALLLEANRPVPLLRLGAAVWPGPAPRSATANLRSHAGALRRLLDGRLAARPGGYQLRVQDAELDADRFTRLAGAGRELLAERRPAAAMAPLDRALALWRGDRAGEGLTRGGWLDARLGALDEQRLDVFEDYVTARLPTRAYSGIVADLREHLARWPIRERCWELLMLTLYRGGDPSAALTAYQHAREVLSGQLGLEPGPGLRRLQRAILHRDPGLDEAAPRESAVLTPVPVAELIGRDTELATLAAALGERPPLVVVSGPGGAGKSALATRAAEPAAGQFPDGRVTVDLASGDGTAAGLAAVLRALGRPVEPGPRTVDELVAAYRAAVSGQRMLIVLDNATDSGLVRLLRSEGLTLLAISRRHKLLVDAAYRVEVAALADQDAAELLTRYAGAGRTGADPEAMQEVAQVCAGLPLALRSAGQWLAAHPDVPVEVYATRLARRPLDGLGAEHPSVRDMLAADLRAIAADYPLAMRVFPILGPAGAVTPEVIAQQLAEDPDRVFFTLEQLVDRWLVESPEPEQYQAARLARAYAVELADTQTNPGSGTL